MQLCNLKHEEVVFEGRDCPACELRDVVKSKESDNEDLRVEIDSLESDVDDLKSEKTEHLDKIKELEDQINDLNSEIADLRNG